MSENTEYLFSYGTLQYENVQLTTFGRKLEGKPDSLPKYSMKKLKITDMDVIAKSGEDEHFIIYYTGNPEDQVSGVVFKISKKELEHADQYEVSDYKRIQITLLSGISAWVYTQ